MNKNSLAIFLLLITLSHTHFGMQHRQARQRPVFSTQQKIIACGVVAGGAVVVGAVAYAWYHNRCRREAASALAIVSNARILFGHLIEIVQRLEGENAQVEKELFDELMKFAEHADFTKTKLPLTMTYITIKRRWAMLQYIQNNKDYFVAWNGYDERVPELIEALNKICVFVETKKENEIKKEMEAYQADHANEQPNN